MNICVVGAGYVGLVAAVSFALHGHRVTCAEASPEKVEAINQGSPPFSEPGLEEALEKGLASGRFKATANLPEAADGSEVIFLCVQTPTIEGGLPDLSILKGAVRQVSSAMKSQAGYQVVVVKSTVTPTTTEDIVLPLLRTEVSKPFGLCVNPEFLREGNAMEDFLHPDRIVIGALDDRSGDVIERLYQEFHAPVFRAPIATAETIKYASNALLATVISFSNEMANICELIPGVDVKQVMEAIHLDHRLSPEHAGERVRPGILSYLVAGCGYGGSCLPKDLAALQAFARHKGYQPPLLEAVAQINNQRATRLVDMAEHALASLRNKRVSVMGLAFKPDTDDMRDSPAIAVVEELLSRGATVQAYDPQAEENARLLWKGIGAFSCASSLEEALAEADAAILVTAWPQFEDLSPESVASLMRTPIIVDGRRSLLGQESPSWRYLGIGKTWN